MKPLNLPVKGLALAALLLGSASFSRFSLADEAKGDDMANNMVIIMPTASTALTMPASPTTPAISTTASTSATSAGHNGFDRPVAIATLDDARGGTEIVSNDMKLAGSTAGNVAINVGTGMNAITGNAFSNMNGLPVVIQNSGANVLIQNAMIVNLQIN